jgi:hypothetical protein
MSKGRRIIYIVWPLLLAACTEQPQTIGSNARQDAAAFQGTGKPFQAQGWKAGDKGSWESQLKVRTQMGQNDYNKVP